jgi:hypothetical protein
MRLPVYLFGGAYLIKAAPGAIIRHSTPAQGLSRQETLDDPVNERQLGNAGNAYSITRRVSGPSVKQTAGQGAIGRHSLLGS